MRKYRFSLVVYAFSFIFLATVLSGCATVFAGKKNTVHVKTGSPSGAQVYLDGEYLGDAPFKMRISKYKLQHGSILEIRKEGFETMQFEVRRSPHIGYVVADILSGVLPLVIDVAAGNIYRPNTRNVHYTLAPIGPQATE